MKAIKVPLLGAVVPDVTLMLDEHSPVQASMLHQLEEGGYEPATWAAIQAILRPGDKVADVGAHVGVISCLMAGLVGPTGSVHSFEPHPDNYLRLDENVMLNGFAHVTRYQVACGAKRGESALFHNYDNDGGHALYDPRCWEVNTRTRLMPHKSHVVPTYPLDVVVTGDLRLVKIDTEGAEMEVLLGMGRFFKAQEPPFLICEINRFGLQQLLSSEAQVRQVLCDTFGYTPFLLWDRGGEKLRPIARDGYLQSDTVFNMLFVPRGAEVPCVS